ncbi:MAG: hypothetical protein ACPG7W_06005, partial [Paracoccaceae bacterium]
MTTFPSRFAPLLDSLRNVAPRRGPQFDLITQSRSALGQDDRIPPLMPRLVIPMQDNTEEVAVYNRTFERGQFLSRQENWEELGRLIRDSDRTRSATPGGVPLSRVLAAGARHDAVQAAVDEVENQNEVGARASIEALTEVQEEYMDDHGVAVAVALAHVDIAWAWRGEDPWYELPTVNKGAFYAHFRAAARIIDNFDAFELDAPSLAAVRCTLLPAERRPDLRVADDYEDLIDLDPGSPVHMRDLGVNLLPAWYGSYERLEIEATRTASRTADIWGSGGYTWTYLDALLVDDTAFDHVQPDLFVAGMRDILTRAPSQHNANMMAAFCGRIVPQRGAMSPARATIARAMCWVLKHHLREVHPLIWMQTPGLQLQPDPLPVEREAQKRGRVRALSVLTEHFAGE